MVEYLFTVSNRDTGTSFTDEAVTPLTVKLHVFLSLQQGFFKQVLVLSKLGTDKLLVENLLIDTF